MEVRLEPMPRAEARAVLDDPPDSPWGVYRVVHAADGTSLGNAGFHGAPVGGVVEIGFEVDLAHRGRGVGTAAVQQLLAIAAAQGAHRLVAGTAEANVPSRRVLEGAGFRRIDDAGGERRYERQLGGLD